MAEQKLFASHNDYSSLQTQAGGTDIEHRFGWCAAASALWCKSMLDASVAPKDSDPSKLRAGILQVKFRWDSPFGGENVSNLFGHLELRADPACAGVSLAELFDSVFGTPGVYWISNYGHAMGVDTRAGRLLFYDIEEGLFQYATAEEMREGIRSRYRRQPVWRAFRAAPRA
jgi:hypothetical protein